MYTRDGWFLDTPIGVMYKLSLRHIPASVYPAISTNFSGVLQFLALGSIDTEMATGSIQFNTTDRGTNHAYVCKLVQTQARRDGVE